MRENSSILETASWIRDIQNQDGAALLDLHQGTCFSVNPVGARIWALMKQRYPLAEITETLASEFEVTGEQVGKDLEEFLLQLTRLGLIQDSERAKKL